MSDAAIIPLFLLPRGARPKPHERLMLEEVKSFRLLGCREYAGCLNFAARVNWSGFHCVSCPRYREHYENYAARHGLLPPIFEEPLVVIGGTLK